MDKGPGELEQPGVSGERKSQIAGGFVGVLFIGIAIGLLLAIVYFAIRKDKTVPPATPQPKTQSLVRDAVPYLYA